jgi:hypothetical protein
MSVKFIYHDLNVNTDSLVQSLLDVYVYVNIFGEVSEYVLFTLIMPSFIPSSDSSSGSHGGKADTQPLEPSPSPFPASLFFSRILCFFFLRQASNNNPTTYIAEFIYICHYTTLFC